MISGLPYDAEVEYLESTGTQWIDTNIEFTGASSAGVDIVFEIPISLNNTSLCGAQTTARSFIGYGYVNSIYFTSGAVAATASACHWGYDSGVKYFAKMGIANGTLSVNFQGSVKTQQVGYQWSAETFALFGNKGQGQYSSVRIYEATISKDGFVLENSPVMGLHFFKSQIKTAKDYVQNGLIAMWDGIENVGYGQHDDNATSWADLTGGGANWLLKDSHTPEMFEVGSDYVKILSTISYEGRGYCSPSWTSVDDLVSCEIVFDADNVDMTNITNARRVFGFMASGTGNRSLWLQSGYVNCGYVQYPCASVPQGVNSLSVDFGVQRAMLNGAFFESTRRGPGWIGMRGPSISGYGYGDAYCAVGAKIKALRVYGRSLTDTERLANYAVDRVRFNLPSSS